MAQIYSTKQSIAGVYKGPRKTAKETKKKVLPFFSFLFNLCNFLKYRYDRRTSNSKLAPDLGFRGAQFCGIQVVVMIDLIE